MASFLFVRHQCGRCDVRFETRATDDAGRPVTSAPPGWSRGNHRGRDYQVCYECLHVGGMGAWLVSEQRETTMGTTIQLRHECDRCHAVVINPADDNGVPSVAPPDWILLAVRGQATLLCPDCIGALREFMQANTEAEQSP